MSLRTARARGTAVAISVLAVAALAVSASPASAAVSSGTITGKGTVTNDWGDEGPLSATQHANSNATKLWQLVLWAEQAEEQNGTVFDRSDVDCQFGPNTTHATKDLQRRWGLRVDGIVGPKTFGRADNNLFIGPEVNISLEYIGYDGKDRVATFQRAKGSWTNGSWYVPQDSDSFYTASYTKDHAC